MKVLIISVIVISLIIIALEATLFPKLEVCRVIKPDFSTSDNLTYDIGAAPKKELLQTPQEYLKGLVLSRGYTYEEWLRNNLPRDVKWEITKEHSKFLLELIKNEGE